MHIRLLSINSEKFIEENLYENNYFLYSSICFFSLFFFFTSLNKFFSPLIYKEALSLYLSIPLLYIRSYLTLTSSRFSFTPSCVFLSAALPLYQRTVSKLSIIYIGLCMLSQPVSTLHTYIAFPLSKIMYICGCYPDIVLG